eukprot:949701-Prymnesium_polylepis.1
MPTPRSPTGHTSCRALIVRPPRCLPPHRSHARSPRARVAPSARRSRPTRRAACRPARRAAAWRPSASAAG